MANISDRDARFNALWLDYLADFPAQRWNELGKKLKGFLWDVSFSEAEVLWDTENKHYILRAFLSLKGKGDIFLFRLDSHFSVCGEECYRGLSEAFELNLNSEQESILEWFFCDFLKTNLKNEFARDRSKVYRRPPTEWEDDEEELEDESEFVAINKAFLSGIPLKKPDPKTFDPFCKALAESVGFADCYLFSFCPKERFVAEEAEINTWLTQSGAPVFKFYRRREDMDLTANFAFEADKPVQMIYLADDEPPCFYWRDQYIWYRLPAEAVLGRKSEFFFLGCWR